MKRALVVLLAVGVAAGGWAAFTSRTGDADDTQPTVRTGTAKVTRKTLVEREDVDGTLGFGVASAVALDRKGTVTRLPAEGDVVERGKPLLWVDETPVVLFYGDVPAFRRLADGVDDGADVKQVEENLKALGYKPGTVDDTWTSSTTAAVKRWEDAVGVTEDGVIEIGDVVFRPAAVRVAERTDVGAPATGEVLKATSATRVVTIDLAATKQAMAKAGDAVEVELPDGRTVAGRVESVGKVATTPQGDQQSQTPTVEVVVTLDDPGDYDQAPVDVRLTRRSRENVLAVPVAALLALAEGGYGVEVANGRLVRVETGLFADGWVEVAGEVAEGMDVVVPA